MGGICKMEHESYNLIKYKYEIGVYSLKKMIEFVDAGVITPEQFHYITSYSYEGIKKLRDW